MSRKAEVEEVEAPVEVDTNEIATLLHLEEKLRGHPKLKSIYDWVVNQLQGHADALTPVQEEAIAEEATGEDEGAC